jgi:hypothetical protein
MPYRPRSAQTNERGRTSARSAAQAPQAPGAAQIAFSTGTSASSGVFARWGRSGPPSGRPTVQHDPDDQSLSTEWLWSSSNGPRQLACSGREWCKAVRTSDSGLSPPLNRRTPLRTSPADRPRPCSSPKPALFRESSRNRLPRSCATIFGAGNPPTGIR